MAKQQPTAVPNGYGSRRAGCSGYLEFIWRQGTPIEPGDTYPQALAYITDIYHQGQPFYVGCFQHHMINGATVAEVKELLFPLMDEALKEEQLKQAVDELVEVLICHSYP